MVKCITFVVLSCKCHHRAFFAGLLAQLKRMG